VRTLLAFVLVGVALVDPPSRVIGDVGMYAVKAGDTLTSLSARAGVELRTLARDNGLSVTSRLQVGDRLVVDNRHIVPRAVGDEIILNVPQRMLFVIVAGEAVHGYPVAVGRANWRTPLGTFAIVTKETDPVWDVPVSIQRDGRFGTCGCRAREAWPGESSR